MKVSFTLNKKPVSIDVDPKMTLLKILREEFMLTGAKAGCEKGTCGTCTVIVNDKAVKSCLFTAQDLEGCSVTSIEGISGVDGTPNDLQLAFLEHGAIQCGYCTPGMIMAGEALLIDNPMPSREEIREAIAGNLCRCTGYMQIVDAIESTAIQRSKKKEAA
jgi:aerobic-type carbon monoxide dehydrogenase small subunit (CoxS/CutS family)